MKKDEELIINNKEIHPGENQMVRMFVGKLPSGNKIFINASVFRSEQSGPTVLLLAGMHGDEFDGIEILRLFLRDFAPGGLLKGTLIVIPVLNIYGFLNFSREVPDGKDVNRSFPGLATGSLASRVANSLTKKILPFIDLILDMHTGGAMSYNFPQIRYTKGDERALELSKVFNAPFTISKSTIPKSLRKIAVKREIPILVYEGGEALRRDEFAINMGTRGIYRVLNYLEMVPSEDDVEYPFIHLGGSSWRRATQAGFFIPIKKSGDAVKKGEVIGTVQDLYDLRVYEIKSVRDGFVIGNSFAPVVHQGDALYHIGYF
jgi:uncharacterized protein